MAVRIRGTVAIAAVITATVLSSGVAATPAHGAAGRETFQGFIVKTGGDVDLTRIAARGVFDGVGRIVEKGAKPGDADNVNRDDLVFRDGTMHLVSTNHRVRVRVNPETCRFSAWVRQTNRVTGGTGMFRHASGRFRGTVHAFGVFPRKADGSCRQNGELLHEIDLVRGRGRLRF
jgi:hypothetical protein